METKNKIQIKRPGTLVFVSNGSWKGYGYFDSMSKESDGYRVTIDAAIPVSMRNEYAILNDLAFVLRPAIISKVTTLRTCSLQEKEQYKNKLIFISKYNRLRNFAKYEC